MSAEFIGMLLDRALAYAWASTPRLITFDAAKMGMPSTGPVRANPRSVARALLAARLRDQVDALGSPAPEEFAPPASYEQICRACRDPRREVHIPEGFDHSPDIVRMPSASLLQVIEVGYGFVEADAIAALDRLLGFMWLTWGFESHRATELIAYVFVHETGFGESIHETERKYNDWIDAQYGPFNGMDRIGLPMRVRLTRTARISPRDGTVLSAIDLETRPTGFAAFAITCQRDRY